MLHECPRCCDDCNCFGDEQKIRRGEYAGCIHICADMIGQDSIMELALEQGDPGDENDHQE